MRSSTVDWSAIHQRLAATEVAIAGSLEPGPEQTRRVLEARAHAAAKPPAKAEDAEMLEVLAFSLAGETYGIETRWVGEVCPLRGLTPLPGTPAFLAGVTSLRGRVLAIYDLRRLFGLPARGLTEFNRIIVLRDGEDEVGLLADAILGTRSIEAAALQEGLPTLTGVRGRFLVGVTAQALAVLDGGRLLADPELEINEQVER